MIQRLQQPPDAIEGEVDALRMQREHVFLATDLTTGAFAREHTEQDMVSRAFPIDEVLAMIAEGVIKDAATVATLGLLRLKGLL